MDDKSYVTLEQHRCVICGKDFNTGALLLDKRLRARFDMHTLTGMGLCPEHQKLYDDGYVALVECDEQRSGLRPDAKTLRPEDAYRTGNIAHIRVSAWPNIFNSPVPTKDDKVLPMVFIDRMAFRAIAQMGQAAG